jgi:hypothetical protein
MRRSIWTMLMAAGLAFAQEQPVHKTIELKYADPNRMVSLLQRATQYLGVQVSDDNAYHLIFLHGPEKAVAEAEAMIKKYDVAPSNIELTVYMISGAADGKTTTDEVPADLVPTVKQLRGLFPYKSYRVLQSFVLRVREGQGGRDSGTLKAPDYARISPLKNPSERMEVNATYDFRFQSIALSSGTPRAVRISGMMLNIATPTGKTDKEGHSDQESSSISSDLDAIEGQKIVVGKSNLHGSEDALILVITAHAIQ